MFEEVRSPGDTPATLTDWQAITNIFQATWLRLTGALIVSGSYIQRGSAVNIGGKWYVASVDIAITGSASAYVKLSVTGTTIAASFVANLTGVSWNKQWNGWYDVTGNYYVFDEVRALAFGQIATLHSISHWRPSSSWATFFQVELKNSDMQRAGRISGGEVVITANGNWTVPANVYWIEGYVKGPGGDGTVGTASYGGDGGADGREVYFSMNVTPGTNIAAAFTTSSTTFGSITASKGGGFRGSRGTLYTGGNGAGIGAGRGGNQAANGGAGTNGTGSGGGGGGSASGSTAPGEGGIGGTGKVVIR
jgi:hypothetical protein